MARFDLNIAALSQATPLASGSHQSANQAGHIESVKKYSSGSDGSNNPLTPLPHDKHGPASKVSVEAAFVITPDGVVHRLDGDNYVPYIDPIKSYKKEPTFA